MVISNLIWVNGEIGLEEGYRPNITSHTLQYGLGIFDGIMAYHYNNHFNILFAKEHFERFVRSGKKLGFNVQFDVNELLAGTKQLLERHEKCDYYIRPILYRPISQIALTKSFSNNDESIVIVLMKIDKTQILKSIDCVISKHLRVKGEAIPVQLKICAAYTNSFLARTDAQKQGFQDGIMLNSEGNICEASAANIFFIKENKLFTPKLNNDIFPGITRQAIINIARVKSVEIVQRDIHSSEINKFSCAFLCATLMEIVPINKINNIELNHNNNIVLNVILNEFDKLKKGKTLLQIN